MKNIILVALSVLLTQYSLSQSVEVKSDSEKINGTRYPGVETQLTAELEDLEKYFKKELRDLGKMRERSTYYEISDVTLNGLEYGERSFYAVLKRSDIIQKVWMGIDTVAMNKKQAKEVLETLENHLYNLGINFYKNEVQEDIDESMKAEAYMVKKQDRLERNQRNLKDELEKNEEELIELEQAIEENKLRHEELLMQIENNKLEQDSTIISIGKIREVIQMKEAKRDSIK